MITGAHVVQGVTCTPPVEEAWGIRTRIGLPGGGVLGLYQPKHPTFLGAGVKAG